MKFTQSPALSAFLLITSIFGSSLSFAQSAPHCRSGLTLVCVPSTCPHGSIGCTEAPPAPACFCAEAPSTAPVDCAQVDDAVSCQETAGCAWIQRGFIERCITNPVHPSNGIIRD